MQDTVANNQNVTAPTTGYYRVVAWTQYDGGTGAGTGIRNLYLNKNAAVRLRSNT